jgi:hypothetical protein
MKTAATIDPFIVAMINATVTATGTPKWNRDAVTVRTVKIISIPNTVR